MLSHGNTSFVVRVTKLVAWQVANDNMYIISQRMKSYYIYIHIPCHLQLLFYATKMILVVNVSYN
jgi:hypothetical protein